MNAQQRSELSRKAMLERMKTPVWKKQLKAMREGQIRARLARQQELRSLAMSKTKSVKTPSKKKAKENGLATKLVVNGWTVTLESDRICISKEGK